MGTSTYTSNFIYSPFPLCTRRPHAGPKSQLKAVWTRNSGIPSYPEYTLGARRVGPRPHRLFPSVERALLEEGQERVFQRTVTQSRVPGPAAPASTGSLPEIQVSNPTPGQLNQKLWARTPATCALTSPPVILVLAKS